jgi:type II secretory pathway pseudopilin PulG
MRNTPQPTTSCVKVSKESPEKSEPALKPDVGIRYQADVILRPYAFFCVCHKNLVLLQKYLANRWKLSGRKGRQMNAGKRTSAFTLVELLVVIGLIALLIAILIPVLNSVREKSNRIKCASNLRQIGQAQFAYSVDSKGQYPRAYATGSGQPVYFFLFPDSWPPESYANDVTAGIFLMVRSKILSVDVFLCPSSTEKRDVVMAGAKEIPPTERSNFSDQKPFSWSVSYCFANQYSPLASADYPEETKFRHSPSAPAENAIAADRNDARDRWRSTNPSAPKSDMEAMNSRNHGGKGQNVLFNDGSVRWCDNPFVGYNRDNIYTRAGPQFPPASVRKHMPAHRHDSNLGPQLPLVGHLI